MRLPDMLRNWLEERGSQLPREWSNDVVRAVGVNVTGEVLNASGWLDSDKAGGRYRDYFPNAKSYAISNHAGAKGLADAAETTDFVIDLEQPLPADLRARFDCVFNHTVLEHVFDMHAAFANLCALSRDAVLVVVPWAQKLHFTDSYGDYWRFSPQALRRLFQANGLTVVLEAANEQFNTSVYIVALAVRQPDAWRQRLPAYAPLQAAGAWIGKNPARGVARRLGFLRRTDGKPGVDDGDD